MKWNKGRILIFTNPVLSYQESFDSALSSLDVGNFLLKCIDESSELHWKTSLCHRMPWDWEVSTCLLTLLSGQYSAIAEDFCHYPLVFPNLLNLINPFLPCPLKFNLLNVLIIQPSVSAVSLLTFDYFTQMQCRSESKQNLHCWK